MNDRNRAVLLLEYGSKRDEAIAIASGTSRYKLPFQHRPAQNCNNNLL